MPDPNDTSIVSERRSFSAPPAEVARRSAVSDSLNLADASETVATNQPTFHDLLDAINPLQHIPVVSWIYREISGDTISAQARIVGDTLYGGVTGLVSGMFNALVEKDTGKDIGSHVMAWFDSKPSTPPTTNVAAAQPSSAPAASTANTSAAAEPAMPVATAPVTATAPTTAVSSAATLMAASAAAASTPSPATTPTAGAASTPATIAGNISAATGQTPQAAQPLSADSQAALARLAADLHASSPSKVTPAALIGGGATAVPAATTANGMPLPAKPVLAARAGGNAGSPSGMSLTDYRRSPVAASNVVPLPSPPLAGTGTSQAAANYAQALELSKQLQNFYQSPDGTQPPAAAPAAAP